MSRLEEIKKRYSTAAIVVFEGLGTVSVDVQDLDWLTEQVELRDEQVQRNFQALENISVLEIIYDRLEKQNKRYREALEFYARRINYSGHLTSGGWVKTPINDDNGERARKALEDEE